MVTKYWQLDTLIEAAKNVCPELECTVVADEELCVGHRGAIRAITSHKAPLLLVINPNQNLEEASATLHDLLSEAIANGESAQPIDNLSALIRRVYEMSDINDYEVNKQRRYDEAYDAIDREYSRLVKIQVKEFNKVYGGPCCPGCGASLKN